MAKRDRVREERKVKQEEAMGAKAKQVRLAALLVCCRVFTRPFCLQRAQAFVAPNEESSEKVKGAAKQEEGVGSAALEMVKKIKAAQALPSSAAASGGLVSDDASKYFAFGSTRQDAAETKHKKSKREGGDADGSEQKKKKKAKD